MSRVFPRLRIVFFFGFYRNWNVELLVDVSVVGDGGLTRKAIVRPYGKAGMCVRETDEGET